MREAVLRVRALCLTSFKAVAVSAVFLAVLFFSIR